VFGLSLPLFFIQVYFLNFATDVLLMAPGVVGLMFAAGRIWDAVTDPAVGYLSDRTRTRLGRRRPWMLAAIPLLLASFAMLWSPPRALGGAALGVWIGVALFGFYSGYTCYSIPHGSLGAELSRGHHDRTRIFGLRHVTLTLGIISAFVALQLVQNAEDPRLAARTVVYLVVPFAALVLAVPPLILRERPEHQGRGAGSPRRVLGDVWRNPHARILLAVLFVEALGGAVIGVLAPFVTKYVVERPEAVALLPAFYVFASVASVPLWVRVSRRFGKPRSWLVGMLGTGSAFGLTIFTGPGDLAYVSVLLVIAGGFAGAGGAMAQSVLADVMDVDEHRTGERKEGAYSAAAGFAFKAAAGCTIALTGLALQASGFEPNVRQTGAALWTLKLLFAGGPFVGNLIGAIIFRRFRLDAAEHARIREELDARHAAQESDR
jgi:GPH family glycoside/pentoside/hexuronide:cation symporter